MGIFSQRGLIYYVILSKNEKIPINTIKDTDSRLLESDYLKQLGGKDEYILDAYCSEHCTLVFPDIQLTKSEQDLLDTHLKRNDVKSHGWYDVRLVFSSF